MFYRTICVLSAIALSIFALTACKHTESKSTQPVGSIPAQGLSQKDMYTIVSPKNLHRDFPARFNDGTVNVVVEVPVGCHDIWEVDPQTGHLKWLFRRGNPVSLNYMGYPANYGSVPQTLLPPRKDGTQSPLRTLVIGPPVERGQVVKAKLLGILKTKGMYGQEEQYLISIAQESPLYRARTIRELRYSYPGTLEIIETWFTNYQGRDRTKVMGYGETGEAANVLKDAMLVYTLKQEADKNSSAPKKK